ncbi:MAG: hypothetical protein IJC91_06545 [Oscillospiraceae bacterium]|nr:hypothetical protein [Oscillospiraceae bacterium]
MEPRKEDVSTKSENISISKKILWALFAVLIVGIAVAIIFVGGFLDPCRKGHSFIPAEAGCMCSECGLSQEHSYESEEKLCRCGICGYETSEHNYVSQEKAFVCENCGNSVSKVDYLCTYLLENGDFYRATYWLRAEVKEYEYELGYCERDNQLVFKYKAGVAWDTSVQIDMDIETGVCTFDYFESFVTGFNPINSSVKGSFKASNYLKEQGFPTATCTGTYANDPSFTTSMRDLAGGYVWACLETSETLLRDFGITLADIGFDNLK